MNKLVYVWETTIGSAFPGIALLHACKILPTCSSNDLWDIQCIILNTQHGNSTQQTDLIEDLEKCSTIII